MFENGAPIPWEVSFQNELRALESWYMAARQLHTVEEWGVPTKTLIVKLVRLRGMSILEKSKKYLFQK